MLVEVLKRLQNFEVDFARRLERALKSDNTELIQIARDDHVKIAEALRRYEREVEESKRDLGHLIPKSEAPVALSPRQPGSSWRPGGSPGMKRCEPGQSVQAVRGLISRRFFR